MDIENKEIYLKLEPVSGVLRLEIDAVRFVPLQKLASGGCRKSIPSHKTAVFS
jgi:hypothetical protein